MSKVLIGKVTSVKMNNTVMVEVVSRTPHKLYGKLLKRSKKYKVDPNGMEVAVGEQVRIEETRPVSKDKHFKIIEIQKVGGKA